MANSKDVVVTGVSTGIGWGTTKVLVSRGFRVFGSVRKPADADRLQREFGNGFVPLMMDITDECLRTGCAGQVSFRVRSAEGRYRWFVSCSELVRAADGTLLYWIGVNLDIEELKQADEITRHWHHRNLHGEAHNHRNECSIVLRS